MKLSLVALAIGTFALGIAEFAMMGILGDVADELDVSIVQAGHLISAYSAGVAIGAPGLIFLRRWPLKKLLILLTAIIAVGNAAAALSPTYAMLLVSRFVSGLPHGAFFGAGAIVCARLASAGGQCHRRARCHTRQQPCVVARGIRHSGPFRCACLSGRARMGAVS